MPKYIIIASLDVNKVVGHLKGFWVAEVLGAGFLVVVVNLIVVVVGKVVVVEGVVVVDVVVVVDKVVDLETNNLKLILP